MKVNRNNFPKWLPLVSIVLFFAVLSGCGPEPAGPKVTAEQANEVASDNYGVKEIKSSELRHLKGKEIELIPEEGKKKTPVYYVIHGVNDAGEKITVYVSSNDEQISFMIKE